MMYDVTYQVGTATQVIGRAVPLPLARWLIKQKKMTGCYKAGKFNLIKK